MNAEHDMSKARGARCAFGVIALVSAFASVGPAAAADGLARSSAVAVASPAVAVGQSVSRYRSIETTAGGAAVDRGGIGLSAGNVAVIITGDVAVTTAGEHGSYTSRATIASLDVVAAPVAADQNGLGLDNLVGVGVDVTRLGRPRIARPRRHDIGFGFSRTFVRQPTGDGRHDVREIDGVLTAPEGTPEPIRIDRVVHVVTADT